MNFKRLKNAAIAGAVFVGLSLFMLALPLLNLSFIPLIYQFWMVAAIRVAMLCALLVHLEGYVQLAKRFGSKLLLISTRLMMLLSAIFSLSLIYQLTLMDSFLHRASEIAGVSMALILVPTFLFAYSIALLYKKLGLLIIASILLVPAYVFFFWQIVPAMIFAVGSAALLWLMQRSEGQVTLTKL